MKKIFFVIFLFYSSINFAQEVQNIFFFNPNYDLNIPLADLKADYGLSSSIGLDFSMISKKNLFYSISNSLMFGSNIKDTTILDHLMDENRNIIDQNGQISDIIIQQRGFNSNLKLGYLFAKEEKSSGLLCYLHAGFHQNKKRIDVRNGTVPQLDENYIKIYDQLRNGLSIGGFLGFLHISEKNNTHFITGIEFSKSYSKNRRDYNFAQVKEGFYNDSFINLKFGWIIPISKRKVREFYYF